MVNPMLEAAQTLEAEGIDAAVIRMLRIHPLPAEALESALSGYRQVIFVEEASAGSGIGQAVSHCLREIVPGCVVHTVDLGSDYVTHGSVKQLYEKHGLDAVSIAKKVREVLARED
jgi:transketolase